MRGKVQVDGWDTLLSVADLLYAHGALCDLARKSTSMDAIFAHRLCDVINNFQYGLRPYLKPDACDFRVNRHYTGMCTVEPIGGWDA